VLYIGCLALGGPQKANGQLFNMGVMNKKEENISFVSHYSLWNAGIHFRNNKSVIENKISTRAAEISPPPIVLPPKTSY
jgi:hypothetical protein